MAFRGSSTQTVVFTLTAVLVARSAWNNVPSWVKDGLLGDKIRKIRQRGDDRGDTNKDILANPATVFAKIKEVLKLAHELSEDMIPDDMPYYKLYFAFMSMIHLKKEMDVNVPQYREALYSKDGVEVSESELSTLLHYLDLAQWSYNPSLVEVEALLRPTGYKLIRHDSTTEPGRVGHFIAVHHDKKEVVLAIKGTSTISDALTDIIGKAIPHSIGNQPEFRCHEGMFVAAQILLEDVQHLIETFMLPAGYKIVICGHSLGAGVSSLLGIFLKQKNPSMPLQVYAFGTPACCSYDASLQCKEYITCVVNNNDCIPRLSLMNLRMMYRLFMKIDAKLDKKGLSPTNFRTARSYLKDLLKTDANMLLSPQELTDFVQENLKTTDRGGRYVDMELYVPGRVVSIWNHTKEEGVIGGKVTTGQSPALLQTFVVTNMVSDHSCSCYRDNLATLLDQQANTI